MRKQNVEKDLPELSRLEQEIMGIVWTLGECTSAEVIAVYTQERTLAKTTIRTVLANLRTKGYLEQVPSLDRGYRLRACVARETVATRSLSTIIRTLFAGSPRHAISHLINEDTIDDNDLNEIQRMITSRKKNKGAKS